MARRLVFPLLLSLLTDVPYYGSAFSPSLPKSSNNNVAINNNAMNFKTNPFNREGLDIELPDFDQMFQKIAQASPLAQSVMNGHNKQRGLQAIYSSKLPFIEYTT